MSIELQELLLAMAEERQDLNLAEMNEATLRWAVKTGLGPLLLQHADRRPGTETKLRYLKGADLVAKLVAAETTEIMVEILTAFRDQLPSVTLLKGISIRDQHYPYPHLRPMRDLDIMVEPKDVPAAERVLTRLGFEQRSSVDPGFYDQHHHSTPLFDRRRGVWVEIHRGLFPPRSALGRENVFGIDNVRRQRRPAEFCGYEVSRLSDELQLVYISAHWAYEFRPVGGLLALFDICYLLKKMHGVLEWETVFEWLQRSPRSRRAVCTMLTYLMRSRLLTLPACVTETIAAIKQSCGRTSFVIVQKLIDQFFVEGRPFRGIANVRNVDILWKILLHPGSDVPKLMLGPLMFLLPWKIRQRLLDC